MKRFLISALLVFIIISTQANSETIRVTRFDASNTNITSNFANTVAVDRFGTVWGGLISADGFGNLVYFDATPEWRVVDTLLGFNALDIVDIDFDASDNIWVATTANGGWKFDGVDTWTSYDQSDNLASINLSSVTVDNFGHIWFGSLAAGISRSKDGIGFEIFQSPIVAIDNRIRGSHNDETRAVTWFATLGGLLRHHNQNGWFLYSTDNSDLHDNFCYSVATDNSDNIWVGTESGACLFDGDNNWTCYTSDNSDMAEGRVNAIVVDDNDNVWFGHEAVGGNPNSSFISRFDGISQWTVYDIPDLSNPETYVDIKDLAIDAEGNIWAATWGEGFIRIEVTASSAADDPERLLPETYLLGQNFPNPFNPSTTIAYSIKKRSDIIISVYDITGRKVIDLFRGNNPVGEYTVNWDGRDESGNRVASGIYLYRLKTEDYSSTKKMILLK